ncbi:MAG: SDR family NAD(P)-dependent oxidoreductase [Deltaproteobacteria bacterium]
MSKIALVTGASSGIGQATAERLAKAGYKVYGTSRRAVGAGQRSFEMVTLDVTSDDSVEAAVSEVVRRDGRIDLLVNNAGFSIAPAGAEESSLEQARSIFDTNFFGILRMTRAVLPHMRRQGSGRIINISSIFGFLPAPYMALYAATKHAIEGYSESLDHEVRSCARARPQSEVRLLTRSRAASMGFVGSEMRSSSISEKTLFRLSTRRIFRWMRSLQVRARSRLPEKAATTNSLARQCR